MYRVHLVLAMQWYTASRLRRWGRLEIGHFFLYEEHSDILWKYSSIHAIKVTRTYAAKTCNYSTSEMTEEFIGIFLQLSIFLFFFLSWRVNSYCKLMNLIAWALFNFLNCSSWQTAVCNVGFRDKLILWQNVNYLHFPPLSLNNIFTATPFTIPQSLLTKCLHAEWRSCSPEHWVFLLQR